MGMARRELMSRKSPNHTPHDQAVSIIERLAVTNLADNVAMESTVGEQRKRKFAKALWYVFLGAPECLRVEA